MRGIAFVATKAESISFFAAPDHNGDQGDAGG